MLKWIINYSLENRFLILFLTILLLGTGLYSLRHIDIDAFPDTTPVQVQINTIAPALTPLEIEQQITFPIEQVLSGLLGLVQVRSISKFGLSQVTVIFEDNTDLYLARQVVSERLQTAELPEGAPRPELGPVATGLGEVFHYLVTSDTHSLEELTTLHNWVIKPRMRSVPGVAEVNTWGGEVRQYQVIINPMSLIKYGLTLDDISDALRHNNLTVGGGLVTQGGESHLVHGIALTTSLDEIGGIVIKAHDGVPVRVRDVGEVRLGHEIRRGAVTANGRGEAVLGLGFMLMGENSHRVTSQLSDRLEDISADMPEGVSIRPVYVRTDLIEQVIRTVEENLFVGALLVIAVLFALLGNLRAGLIVAMAIPFSMLFAMNMMMRTGIAASLMSLGAIDFGLVVDSSVIMVENSVRRLRKEGSSRPIIDIVRDASMEVRKPTIFGELIIMIVFLPVLALEGIEGKMFRPMALTMIFALLGSLILSVTLMPVLTSLFLPKNMREKEGWLVRRLKALYRPCVRIAIRARWLVVSLAILLLVGGGLLFTRLGSEFIPRLSEMGIVINTVRLAGISLDESVRYGTQIERLILKKFPDEVRDVWSRTGTAEVATDPMGLEVTDVFLTLHPREKWVRARTQEELTELMASELAALPAMRVIFSQPIEMRVNEMVAGIRADLGVKIFGDDLEALREKSAEVQAALEKIPGASDIYTEQITGQPMLEVNIDQQSLARYGVTAKHVLEMVESVGGIIVGEVRDGQRRFDLAILLPDSVRNDPNALGRLFVSTADGAQIPLALLAAIGQIEGPNTITREWQKRRIVVQCNVRGRDVAGFVAEARERIDAEVSLPIGYHIEFGGQFEHLNRARQRLMFVVPAALILILVLLYLSTESMRSTFMIFTGAPFATLGGIVLLSLRGMPFTISAGVGFVAVCGVSMLNGLVMVATIRQMISQGVDRDSAIIEGAVLRLRPVLMTALVASLGFLPMMLNTGVGAEVQRPLATVVVGGVLSDTILTLLVLPALYRLFGATRPEKA